MDPGSPSDVGEGPFVNGLSEVAPLPRERGGVLFDNLSGDEEATTATDRMQRFVPDDVFPVNRPPSRKKDRVDAPVAKRPRGDTARTTKKPPKGVASGSSNQTTAATETCGTSGVAGAAPNPYQLARPPGAPGSDLLDDRVVGDADEVYDDNERALSEFIRMHPMLRYAFRTLPPPNNAHFYLTFGALCTGSLRSLDATSDRMLNKVAAMIDQSSVETKEVEVATKSHDDCFLRPANVENGERPCCNGDKCTCRWTAIFRYGEHSDRAFIAREYLLPSQEAEFRRTGELPRTTGKCLLCTRYYTTHIYTLARNSPSFCPNSAIQIQAFCNKLVCESPSDDAPSHSSSIGSADGYRASVMLFVDEKWADTSSSRNGTSALLWKPTVRFNCSDYEFVVDADGTPRAIQVNMAVEQRDFGSPPCS